MKKLLPLMLSTSLVALATQSLKAQNIFSGEPVQVVGNFNGYATTPYNSDYRTTTFRRVSLTAGTPTDGRGQWATRINVQASGGNVVPINMPGGAGNGFLFISGPTANRFANKWTFASVAQAGLNVINNITAYNSGNDMGLNMNTAGYYSFVFNDVGYTVTNAQYYVGYTATLPVTVSNTNVFVNANGSATVSLTTSAAPSSQENIFVRYSIGTDFNGAGTSNIVQVTGSGTSYTALIPNQGVGANVRYYIFTSTQTLAELNAATETRKSLALLNFDDNNGTNYGYSISVVPVKFTSFTSAKSKDGILLYWAIESNDNINTYDVQSANDGVNFKSIAIVNGTVGVNKYSYSHAQKQSNNLFYRIIAIEKDGNKVNSKIIRVANSDNENTLNVYPNPATTFINIELPKIQAGIYNVTIVNVFGQILQTKSYTNISNTPVLTLPINSNFSKGLYYVTVNNKCETYKSTFFVN